MDAIRKKMQSLKAETENLFKTIKSLEIETSKAEDVAKVIFGISQSVFHSQKQIMMQQMTS